MNKGQWTRTLVALASIGMALAACGESESNGSGSDGATGGSGGTASSVSGGGTGGVNGSSGGTTSAGGGSGGQTSTDGPSSMMCDGTLCKGLSLGIPGGPEANACCPDGTTDEPCGVETAFLEGYGIDLMRDCQQLNSPGELDDSCPESPPVSVSGLSFKFPGCCLPAGKCGFMMDSILAGLITLNLGCIDATELPNPDFADPPDCGPTMQGEGGAGGAR